MLFQHYVYALRFVLWYTLRAQTWCFDGQLVPSQCILASVPT